MIYAENLTKSFKLLNRREGILGAARDLFSADYRLVNAVIDVSFYVAPGEIIGFLGSNGAGKSTTIKMMVGALAPTSGRLSIGGYTPSKDRKEYVRNIGVVFGQRSQLWWDIPVIESFKALKEIYRIEDSLYKRNMDIFLGLGGFESILRVPVRNLSLGQRMLCDILSAFLHNPDVVFLDEPTIGLDISVKSNIRHMIRNLNEINKTTVVLTSHDIGDVEELCDRIIMLDQGRVIYDGMTNQFQRLFGSYRTVSLQFDRCASTGDRVADRIKEWCETTSEIRLERINRTSATIAFNEESHSMIEILASLLSMKGITDIRTEDMELGSVVKRVYEERAV